jgi:uncharacterized protein (DUF488 family)
MAAETTSTGTTITTVGHGQASQEGFLELVAAAGIATVVDVRRFPGSRRHPHFSSEAMQGWLPAGGIGYRWLVELGGRRTAVPTTPNVALRNEQFRGYADHMATPAFAEGIEALLEVAGSSSVAVMCSEAVWWRCHRRLLADHLVLVAEVDVDHLFHDGRRTHHPVTPGARSAGDHVVYDAEVDPT